MNKALIDNWNKVVKPEDDIYHLGDFSFASNKQDTIDILKQLKGRKHLIWGNHDKQLKEIVRSNPNLVASHQDYKELKYDNRLFVLFHYGQRVWNKSHVDGCYSIHLYGHSHGTLPPYNNSVDVGVDAKFITEEYRPISIDEVVKYFTDRNINKTVSDYQDSVAKGAAYHGE